MWLGKGPTEVIFSNMTGIDNGLGLGIGGVMPKMSHDRLTLRFKNSKIYGESPAPDCPQDGKGGYCDKSEKCGFMAATTITKPKFIHPIPSSAKPYHKPKSYGAWGGILYLD